MFTIHLLIQDDNTFSLDFDCFFLDTRMQGCVERYDKGWHRYNRFVCFKEFDQVVLPLIARDACAKIKAELAAFGSLEDWNLFKRKVKSEEQFWIKNSKMPQVCTSIGHSGYIVYGNYFCSGLRRRYICQKSHQVFQK